MLFQAVLLVHFLADANPFLLPWSFFAPPAFRVLVFSHVRETTWPLRSSFFSSISLLFSSSAILFYSSSASFLFSSASLFCSELNDWDNIFAQAGDLSISASCSIENPVVTVGWLVFISAFTPVFPPVELLVCIPPFNGLHTPPPIQ